MEKKSNIFKIDDARTSVLKSPTRRIPQSRSIPFPQQTQFRGNDETVSPHATCGYLLTGTYWVLLDSTGRTCSDRLKRLKVTGENVRNRKGRFSYETMLIMAIIIIMIIKQIHFDWLFALTMV